MSKRASPPILGAFIVGGLILIAVAIIVVGSRGLLTRKSRLVLYFPGSVNGLLVGSPVKYRGVTIGSVASIRISLSNADSRASIPVTVEVDDNLIADTTGVPLDLSNPKQVSAMIERGLRGSLEIESLLTGMLYVGLDTYPNAPPPILVGPRGGPPEIPTVQTGLQKLAGSLPKVERILDRVESVAGEMESLLKQIQAGKINQSVLDTLSDLQRVLRAPSITNSLVSVEKMADEFRMTATDLRGDLRPLMTHLTNTLASTERTVAEFDRTLADARVLIGDNSPLLGQMVSTLAEFQRTAVSLRQLADYLARNPQTILTGRESSQDPKP